KHVQQHGSSTESQSNKPPKERQIKRSNILLLLKNLNYQGTPPKRLRYINILYYSSKHVEPIFIKRIPIQQTTKGMTN
ncbi:Phytochrome, two-component sensor histidine kinase, partial [Sesbania bispinosa]